MHGSCGPCSRDCRYSPAPSRLLPLAEHPYLYLFQRLVSSHAPQRQLVNPYLLTQNPHVKIDAQYLSLLLEAAHNVDEERSPSAQYKVYRRSQALPTDVLQLVKQGRSVVRYHHLAQRIQIRSG